MAQTPRQREIPQNGFAIRDFRIKAGLKVGDLANLVGISYAHMQNIEHQNRAVSDEHLAKIATALDVRVASLVRRPREERAAATEPVSA